MSRTVSPVVYDELLDYIDDENIEKVVQIFTEYNLTLNDHLHDSPRLSEDGEVMNTYLDYILAHKLWNLLNFIIVNNYISVNDELLAKCIHSHCLDTYYYLIEQYPDKAIPFNECAKEATKMCYSDILDGILSTQPDAIQSIQDDTIEYLFSFDIDEDTLETVRVLFNHGINGLLFERYMPHLKNGVNDDYFSIKEDNQDLVIELIDLLEDHCLD